MRVAILTTSYPRDPGDAAGHFIETEARALAREGHDVHVIAPGRRGSARLVDREQGWVTVWGAGGRSLFGSPGAMYRARERPHRLLALTRFMPAVRRLHRALAPVDRTIAHFLVPSGYPLALGATGELEVVVHGSDLRVVLALPHAIRAHIVSTLLGRGAHFRFVSSDLRSKLSSAIDPRDRERLDAVSRVALPPIDVPLPGDLAPRPSSESDAVRENSRPKWVVCGRLVASKRVDRAIREAARRNVDLTVVGDGPMRAELEALAASLEPRARFVGQLARGDALAIIASSHRLLHLSEAEGAPTVIREARALGVPVLATAVGDVANWAKDDPGIEIFRPK